MSTHVIPNCKPSTIANYRYFAEKMLCDIGSMELNACTPAYLKGYMAKLAKLSKRTTRSQPDTGAPCSPISARTLQHYYDTLSYMMGEDVRMQLLYYNPMDRVTRPKSPRRRPTAIDDAHAVELLRELTETAKPMLTVSVLLALMCGLRLGEACALTWSDIDLSAGRMTISRAAYYTAEAGSVIGHLPVPFHVVGQMAVGVALDVEFDVPVDMRGDDVDGASAPFLALHFLRLLTVKSILSNEKYRGDALLQKTFTVDFLTKKAKVNEGEAPQYYVENSHPAIVSAEVFELVQAELAKRRQRGGRTSAVTPFSGRLVCGECGAYFGSKVWHSTDAYRSVIYRCNRKYEKKGAPCPSPHVREEELRTAFEKALGMLLERRSEIFSAYETIIANLTDTAQLDRELERAQARLDEAHQEMERMARRNAEIAQDQEEYNRAFDALSAKCSALKEKIGALKAQLAAKAGRRRKLEAFMAQLREKEALAPFDERTFAAMVDHIVVYPGEAKGAKKLIFRFRDGTEIPVDL